MKKENLENTPPYLMGKITQKVKYVDFRELHNIVTTIIKWGKHFAVVWIFKHTPLKYNIIKGEYNMNAKDLLPYVRELSSHLKRGVFEQYQGHTLPIINAIEEYIVNKIKEEVE